MPAAANLTIKNASLVDKTFTLMTPAAGDGSSALWALREGTISSVFPTIEESSRRNQNRNARKAQITIKIPSSFTTAATGLTAVGSAMVFNVTSTVPDDFPEALKDDAVAFLLNGIQGAILKACLRDGLSAN